MKAADGPRPRDDRVFPRAWLGDSYDFSFTGLKTAARRTIARPRGRGGLPADEREGAAPEAASRSWPGASRTRSWTCSRRRRSGRPRRSGARRSCWAAAWPPTRRCATGSPAGRPRAGSAIVIPRPGLCTDNGAMIGAAGARRFAAGVRAGLDLDARPSLPLRPVSACAAGGPSDLRLDPRVRPAPAPRGGPAGRATTCPRTSSPTSDVLEAILERGGPAPGPRRPGDRARARDPDRRAARGGRAVTAVELDRRPGRGVRSGDAFAGGARAPGAPAARRGRRAGPGPRRTSCRRPTTSSPTSRTTSPARSCTASWARRPGRSASC